MMPLHLGEICWTFTQIYATETRKKFKEDTTFQEQKLRYLFNFYSDNGLNGIVVYRSCLPMIKRLKGFTPFLLVFHNNNIIHEPIFNRLTQKTTFKK